MRLLITADLHFNHRGSRPLAEQLIAEMNRAGGDVLLVVGDTAAADGDDLERCLGMFKFAGPRLFVAGNHELWTRREDSHRIFVEEMPRRVRELGWQWLQSDPFVKDDLAIVGSIGWYDYAFAPPELGIPRRFYEQKVSPGAVARLGEFQSLLERTDDIPPAGQELLARWNDGKFVKLHRTDEDFLNELLGVLGEQLQSSSKARTVVAAIHHVPFEQLLPPLGNRQWDFARAFLGSPRLGELLLAFPNVRHVFCGHSHFPRQLHISHINAINIGSGYRHKAFRSIDID